MVRRRWRRVFSRFLLAVAVLLGTTLILQQTVITTQLYPPGYADGPNWFSKIFTPKPTVFIPHECQCKDETTGAIYNFCYSLNIYNRGKKFSCSWLPIVKRLGLLESDEKYFNFRNGEKFPEPMFVTGCSESHFVEELRAISTLQTMFPAQKIVFFDLGLNSKSIAKVNEICNVEYRKFQADAYPDYAKALLDYRWKPLIIAEALNEFGSIWWFDSSVVWKKNNLSHVYDLVNCNFPHGKGPPPPTQALPDPKWVSSGWHKDQWRMSVWRCDKFPYMLQGFTGHGIFSATHPTVFDYIPSDMQYLKQESAKMYEAGFIFAVRTPAVVKKVLKWYVLCALEKDCMAPSGARLGCHFDAQDRYGIYANCHRYDQSVVNLLLANSNNYHSYYYTSGIVDFFNIIRGGGSSSQPKICSQN